MCTQPTKWEKCVDFHGHECPGLAVGFMACHAAMEKMGIGFSNDEELVCVTENDACGVDAIQVLTGCTFGKGNLIHRGTGKMAFSFFNRANGDSLRMILKPIEKQMTRDERQDYILHASIDELFSFGKPSFEIPEMAKIFNTILCEVCGEGAAENKIRMNEGKKVCLDCALEIS